MEVRPIVTEVFTGSKVEFYRSSPYTYTDTAPVEQQITIVGEVVTVSKPIKAPKQEITTEQPIIIRPS
jgi:hypothetical protein